MSGKLLIEWRHEICKEIAQKRYGMDQEKARIAHAEIVNLFFPQESDDSEEAHSEISEKSSEFIRKCYGYYQYIVTFLMLKKCSKKYVLCVHNQNVLILLWLNKA